MRLHPQASGKGVPESVPVDPIFVTPLIDTGKSN